MSGNQTRREPHWLNKKQMAAARRITPQAFDQWGVKPVAKVGRETFFEVADVVQAARQRQVCATSRVAEDPDYVEEWNLLARRRREKIELELEERRRKLIRVEEVQDFIIKMINNARARLLAIPTKAAPEVYALENIADVQGYLKALIYEALYELSEYDPKPYKPNSK